MQPNHIISYMTVTKGREKLATAHTVFMRTALLFHSFWSDSIFKVVYNSAESRGQGKLINGQASTTMPTRLVSHIGSVVLQGCIRSVVAVLPFYFLVQQVHSVSGMCERQRYLRFTTLLQFMFSHALASIWIYTSTVVPRT